MKHEGKMKGHKGDCWTDEFQNFEPLPARYATLEWRCNTCDRPMSRVLSRAECKGPVAPKPSPEQCDTCRLAELLGRIEVAESAIGQRLPLARSIIDNAIQEHLNHVTRAYDFFNQAKAAADGVQAPKFEVSKLDVPKYDHEPMNWSLVTRVRGGK